MIKFNGMWVFLAKIWQIIDDIKQRRRDDKIRRKIRKQREENE